LEFGSRLGMELDGFGLVGHLHPIERLESLNAFGPAGVNLLNAPPDLVPKRGLKLVGFFSLMDGHDQVLVER